MNFLFAMKRAIAAAVTAAAAAATALPAVFAATFWMSSMSLLTEATNASRAAVIVANLAASTPALSASVKPLNCSLSVS